MSWLKPFLENSDYAKQAAFAAAMSISERTVARWESHETQIGIPFVRIAALLSVKEDDLRKAHAESLESFLKNQREEARMTKRQGHEVESHLIEETIAKIASERFQSHLLRSTGTDSPSAAAKRLADLTSKTIESTACGPCWTGPSRTSSARRAGTTATA